MRSRFIDRGNVGMRLKPIARPASEGRSKRLLAARPLGRIGLVLLGPGVMLFVPERKGPRDRLHAGLSVVPAKSEAPALPVVLAPRRTAPRPSLRELVERSPVHLLAEHGALRRADGLS